MDLDFKNNLIHAGSKEEFLRLIDGKESNRYEKKVEKADENGKSGYRVLAVTACPTGIAHTFMAVLKKNVEGGPKV